MRPASSSEQDLVIDLFPDDDAVDERREEAGYVCDGVGDPHEGAGVVRTQVADVDDVTRDFARRQRGSHDHGRHGLGMSTRARNKAGNLTSL